MCVVCVSLCGDHAFVRVMSTEKYVCSVCVFLFMVTMLLCGSCQLRSMCVVCVSLQRRSAQCLTSDLLNVVL